MAGINFNNMQTILLDVENVVQLGAAAGAGAGAGVSDPLEVDTLIDKAKEEFKEKKGRLKTASFTLVYLSEIRRDSTTRNDHLGYSEDFRTFSKPNVLGSMIRKNMGRCHLWKRMNFTLVIFNYIAQETSNLKGCTFPFPVKDQFAAERYLLHPSCKTEDRQKQKYERCHISFISKIVVQKGNDEPQKLEGDLFVQNKETNLSNFLNICDYAPATMNSIDSICEKVARPLILEGMGQLVNKTANLDVVVKGVANQCIFDLKRIQTKIDKRDSTWTLPNRFSCERERLNAVRSLGCVISDKDNAKDYLAGMLEGVNEFVTKFLKPGSKDLYVQV